MFALTSVDWRADTSSPADEPEIPLRRPRYADPVEGWCGWCGRISRDTHLTSPFVKTPGIDFECFSMTDCANYIATSAPGGIQ
jgi:hypothetical protein